LVCRDIFRGYGSDSYEVPPEAYSTKVVWEWLYRIRGYMRLSVRLSMSPFSSFISSFAAAGPRVWNSLPAELRQCDSLGQFKRCLKTYLFGIWDHGAL